MPCYKPLTGYRAKSPNPKTGKRAIVFNTSAGYVDQPVKVACGRCVGCRLEYSRQWAVRCTHEAQMHAYNSFITLTYDEQHLPNDNSISKRELQTFFKRLRKLSNEKLRYFACGEYGERNNRPHYHAIIFGYGFPDRTLWSLRDGVALYRSSMLERAWKKGFSTVGEATFESAAYVARYVLKKRKGDPESKDKNGRTNREHYQIVDRETGELHELEPEFCLMSRRPGIGNEWLHTYKGDTDKDYITVRGKKMSLPRYYDTLLEMMDEDEMKERKWNRQKNFNRKENKPDRLQAREAVKKASIELLPRNLENINNGT